MAASDEELADIWARYATSQDPGDLELLVVRYEPLARYLAKRALAKAPPYQDREDILSYAHHGLLDAIKRFEPGRVKFETYASRRIAGAIIDGQRKQDPLSRGIRKRVKALTAAQVEIWNVTGQEASITQLAAAIDGSENEVRKLLLEQKSLAGSLDDDADGTTVVEAHSSPDVGLQMAEMRDGVSARLSRLGMRERVLIFLHYCQELSISEVAKTLNLTEARCRQIRTNALESLLY